MVSADSLQLISKRLRSGRCRLERLADRWSGSPVPTVGRLVISGMFIGINTYNVMNISLYTYIFVLNLYIYINNTRDCPWPWCTPHQLAGYPNWSVFGWAAPAMISSLSDPRRGFPRSSGDDLGRGSPAHPGAAVHTLSGCEPEHQDPPGATPTLTRPRSKDISRKKTTSLPWSRCMA